MILETLCAQDVSLKTLEELKSQLNTIMNEKSKLENNQNELMNRIQALEAQAQGAAAQKPLLEEANPTQKEIETKREQYQNSAEQQYQEFLNTGSLPFKDLPVNEISDQELITIAPFLAKDEQIKSLVIRGNEKNISDTGIAALAEALKTNSYMEGLSLINVRITELGAQAIVDALKINKGIKKLSITVVSTEPNQIEAIFSDMLSINNTIKEFSFSQKIQSHIGQEIFSEKIVRDVD